MKKRLSYIIVIAFLLLLCVYIYRSKSGTAGSYIMKGTDGSQEVFQYAADTAGHTVTIDGDTYSYDKTDNALTVTWPDGVSYTKTYHAGGGAGGSSGEIDHVRYLPEEAVFAVLEKALGQRGAGNMAFMRLFFILLGAAMAVYPKIFWFASYGWQYQNAEPGRFAGTVIRGTGVLVAVFAALNLL